MKPFTSPQAHLNAAVIRAERRRTRAALILITLTAAGVLAVLATA